MRYIIGNICHHLVFFSILLSTLADTANVWAWKLTQYSVCESDKPENATDDERRVSVESAMIVHSSLYQDFVDTGQS